MSDEIQQGVVPSSLSHTRQLSPGRRISRKPPNLLPGPPIAGHQILRHEASHAVVIDHLMIRCTPEEYRLLLRLMENYERPVLFDDLIAQFQNASHLDQALWRVAKRKLICMLSHLRNKLWPTDFAIVQITDVGYMLLPQSNLWSFRHADLEEAAKPS